MKNKLQKLLILCMAVTLGIMVWNLIPTKEEKALEEQRKKIEEEKRHEGAILTQAQDIDLQKSLLELETEKAELLVESISDSVEFILRTEDGTCVTKHTTDGNKNDFELFFTHKEIEIENYYTAVYSIQADKIHSQVVDGECYLTYDSNDIVIKTVEIKESVPLVDKSFFSKGYSNEELLALIDNAREYLYANLLTQNVRETCCNTLNEFLLGFARNCGVTHVNINAEEVETEVGYEFIEMPTLTNNHPNKLLDSVDALVIHSTGVVDKSCEVIYNNFNTGDRKASAHFIVDYDRVIQCLPTNYVAWHIGKGSDELGLYNSNTIGIEMCEYSDPEKQAKVLENAQMFVKTLAQETNCNNIKMHREVGQTICPSILTDKQFEEIFKK